jgi:hypothetical protein
MKQVEISVALGANFSVRVPITGEVPRFGIAAGWTAVSMPSRGLELLGCEVRQVADQPVALLRCALRESDQPDTCVYGAVALVK